VERLELPPPEERRRASVMLDVMEVRKENEETRVRRGKEDENENENCMIRDHVVILHSCHFIYHVTL
jgi:hypothetical protein